MSPEPITVAVTTDPDMPAWAIRLEAKVDLIVAQQTQRLDGHGETLADHENRIRKLEAEQPEDARHRLRAVEERKTISPSQLWAAVASGVATIGAASTAITILIK